MKLSTSLFLCFLSLLCDFHRKPTIITGFDHFRVSTESAGFVASVVVPHQLSALGFRDPRFLELVIVIGSVFCADSESAISFSLAFSSDEK